MSQSNTDGRSATLRVPATARATRESVADADVHVAAVGPTGIGSLDPLVTATLDGRTAFYPACSPERAADVATRLAAGSLADGAAGVATHDSGTDTLPRPDVGGLDVGSPRLLGGAGWRDPVDADDFTAALDELDGVTVEQYTPQRVDHRRANLTRTREVYDASGELDDSQHATVEIHGAGGLYIKELVSGDDGRTDPSLAGLLDVGATVTELDVLDVTGEDEPFEDEDYFL